MARAALQLGVRDVAQRSGVSVMTIHRFETGKTCCKPETLARLRCAYEDAGITFIDAVDGTGSGVLLTGSETRA